MLVYRPRGATEATRLRTSSFGGFAAACVAAKAPALPLLIALLVAAPAFAQAPPPPPHDMQAMPDPQEYPRLKISGFGDLNFATTKHPEGPRGFVEGQLALHMASQLSPRVTFFGEISFTPRGDAGTGSPTTTGFNVEVERMVVRFDRNDRLKVSFGRYHTPVNYWNTAFHHGQWLQTTIARPELIQFGGRFLPVHFVGALVEGAVPARGWNLNYKAGVGNGRGPVLSRAGDAGDVNGKRSWLVNAYSKPDALFGLEFGGALYVDTITMPDAREFGERIVSAYAAWQKEEPELIAEFAAVRHRENGSGTDSWSRAFYVQAAWRLPPLERAFKPYYRFEHVGIDEADEVFAPLPELDMSIVGLRYDVSLHAAAKAEYRTWTRGDGSVRNHGGFFQVCFTF
jgi:hypothetical protein